MGNNNLLAEKIKAKKLAQEKKDGEKKKPNPLAKKIADEQLQTKETQKDIKTKSTDENKVVLIKISDITPLYVNGEVMHNRSAMATKDKEELNNFALSLKDAKKEKTGLYKTGLINAITVRSSSREEGKYELIAGFRRTEAFKINDEEFIPALIIKCNDKVARKLRNAENKQRRAVNAYDETYGELEEIQLYCNFGSLHETEKVLRKTKRILEKVSDLRKKNPEVEEGDLISFVQNNSNYTQEELFASSEFSKAVFELTQKQLITFVNRLEILNINETIKNYMFKNEISYSEALEIKKILKDDDEKIHEAVKYLIKEEKQNQRPSVKLFSKWLKERFNYQSKNRGHKTTKLSTIKKIVSLIREDKINKLDKEKQKEYNYLVDEITKKIEELQNLIK